MRISSILRDILAIAVLFGLLYGISRIPELLAFLKRAFEAAKKSTNGNDS